MNERAPLRNLQKQASYDYKHRWDATAQPMSGFSEEEYTQLAKAAQIDIQRQIYSILDQHSMSYIVIPHEAFKKYESGNLDFREWLERYCEEENARIEKEAKEKNIPPTFMDPRSDFAIVSRVKELDSSQRKTATGEKQADRIIDYLGIQLIALKQTAGKANKQSLDTMERAMGILEEDQGTLARKNHYWYPHPKTKFRGHKTLRVATPSQESGLSEFPVLAEVKLEHESQMDIDKLTRRFINIGRSAQKAMTRTFDSSVSSRREPQEVRRASKFIKSESDKQQAIDALGAILYNRVFADIGMNRFMDPKLVNNFPALPITALMATARETINEHFESGKRDLLKMVECMKMFEPLRQTKRPTRRKSRRLAAGES